MKKRVLLAALGGLVALVMSVLIAPAPAMAANPDQISDPTRTSCFQPASTEHGALIVQARCDGSVMQRWTRDGSHFINNGSGFCLNASGITEAGHIMINQWTCNRNSNENWETGSNVPGAVTTLISRISGSRDKCAELPGGSPGWTNGWWLSRCNGTFAQQFLLPG